MTKDKLCRYTLLSGEVERLYERMAELESAAKNTSSIEINTFEAKIEAALAEMREIRNAIDGLYNPMERVVLHMRYTDGEIGQLMPWKDIAQWIYGSTTEKHLQAAFRLHKQALESIGENSQ